MTALSLIVQPHAAYLLTDTASYLADGTVVAFAPKVTELHFGGIQVGSPSASAAFAVTGIISAENVKAVLATLPIADVNDLLAFLPAVVQGISVAIPNMPRAPGVSDEQGMLLALALWDAGAGRPYGFLIGNEASHLVEEGHMKPFELVRMSEYVMRQGGFPIGTAFADPAVFDPIRDGGALLDAQRDDPFGDDETQFCGVGGQGVLTEIGAAGIRYHLLRSWPDKVGERIAA